MTLPSSSCGSVYVGPRCSPSEPIGSTRRAASFTFALASAAVALDLRGRTIGDARIALGGLATKPWRARDAERYLIGKPPALDHFQRAAAIAVDGAAPRTDNAFKVELGRRTVLRALQRGAS